MPSIGDLLLEKKRYGLSNKISLLERIKLKIGMPVQKIIGYIEMSNIIIKINKKVLIPRYETEELIELAKSEIIKNNYLHILDMCAGSGFIGIALKKWNPNLKVTCVDIDKNAITQTKINAQLNNVDLKIIKSDLFNKLSQKFDLIISNPPYVDHHEEKITLRFEPKKAIFAKDQGMFFYKKIHSEANKYLNNNGCLILEINPLKVDFFNNLNYQITQDINQKNRFAFIKINQF